MSTNNNYNVSVSEYAKKHYIKNFEKKYKNAWDTTFLTIKNLLSRIDLYLKTSKIEKIHICDT
jgi:hypothetical protein